jgi:cell division protein FtsA
MKAIDIAAIDIGFSKVCTLIGTTDGESGFRILGAGIAPAKGIAKGLVTDSAALEESIRQSVNSTVIMAGRLIESACIGLSGRHLSSMNSRSIVAITHRNRTVHLDDISRALKIALDIQLPAGRKLLQVIPRTFSLDGQSVQEPVGMYGDELKVEMHMVMADMAPVQNLARCVNNAGVKIKDMIPSSWASAEAILSEDEKQHGVLIADIGAGSTDIAVIKNGSVYHTSALSTAGQWITDEVAARLGISLGLAEEIKKKYGRISRAEEDNDIYITVGNSEGRISQRDLDQIISIRTEALLHLIVLSLQVSELPRLEYHQLIPSGLVITGGSSGLPGINELAHRITSLPVRTGFPLPIGNFSNSQLHNPSYATGVGLLLWQIKNRSTLKWWSRSSGIPAFTA